MSYSYLFSYFFFFNDPATTEIYTLSLHDALPICLKIRDVFEAPAAEIIVTAHEKLEQYVSTRAENEFKSLVEDRKSTRLNSSHVRISYAVFCLKKKKKKKDNNNIKNKEKNSSNKI